MTDHNYYNIEETVTNIDSLVRDELMIQYKLELEHGTTNTDLLDALLQVIKFYCTGKEYRDFYLSINGENNDNAI